MCEKSLSISYNVPFDLAASFVEAIRFLLETSEHFDKIIFLRKRSG